MILTPTQLFLRGLFPSDFLEENLRKINLDLETGNFLDTYLFKNAIH